MQNITMLNGYVAVTLDGDKKTLGNGITINETRGRKDIVSGLVISSDSKSLSENDRVYFPLYAATALLIEGEMYYVVNRSDIIMVQQS